MSVKFDFKNDLVKGVNNFNKKFQSNDINNKKDVAIGLLGYVLDGSPKESVVPPVLDGFLRGSASVFVGGKLAAVNEKDDNKFVSRSSDNNDNSTITVAFNVPYAAKMHEHEGDWGPVSKHSGDVGRKFIEKHIFKDASLLIKFYASLTDKGLK